MTITIEIRELKEIQIRGGVFVDCLRGGGLDKELIARCLVQQLDMEPIAFVESDSFPSICTVIGSAPNFPMRIYANLKTKVCVVASDFEPSIEVQKALGRSLLSWARSKSIAFLITSFIAPADDLAGDIGAVCSTSNARLRLKHSRIGETLSTKITGIPAIFLNEGYWTNFDVIALLSTGDPRKEANVISPEESVIRGIDVLLPEIKINIDLASSATNEKAEMNLDPRLGLESET